ncbi:MAG: WD40 repeat domain-containing protein [Campylobacterales bacterium]
MFNPLKMIAVLILSTTLFSSTVIKPTKSFDAGGAVVDMVKYKDKLYVSTAESIVSVFKLGSFKKLKVIKLPKIKDFMGNTIETKIYSVDVLDDKILILSQGEHGFRNIELYNDGKFNSIISVKDKLYIAKAKFLDKDNIIFALLGNDIISYNIKTKKRNWTKQASGSKFSNFVLNEDKSEIVVCDESGDLKIMDTKTGKIKKVLANQNLDNVFQADYKNGIIITAGQDRRSVVYNLKTNSSYYKATNFLIYSAGLSPDGKIAGFANDEDNDVTIFNTQTKKKIAVLGDNKMIITNILFLNEKEVIISSDDRIINYYKLK